MQLYLSGKTKDLNCYVEALCVPYMCSPLKEHFVKETQSQFHDLKELQLSETKQQNEITDIDTLTGLDFYYSLVSGRIKRGFPSDSVAVESVFRWMICGPTSKTKANKHTTTTNYTVSHTMRFNTKTLNSQLTKFWEEESSGTFEKGTFNSKTFTDQLKFDGKNYVTKLPFKNTDDGRPDNYQLCLKRLESLKGSLDKDQTSLTDYNEIIKNYLENGIIEKDGALGEPGLTTYLPHRPVVKPSRKIRIVYGGSTKTKGTSLNETLHTGPSLLTLIFDILLRFRTNPIALISDIQQAFHKIKIDESHRDVLRFLWYNNILNDDPNIIAYRFARLLFGLTSSPFILNSTINLDINKFENLSQEKGEQFLRDLYVDNSTTSFANIKDAYDFYCFVLETLRGGGFSLHKWCTISKELSELISADQQKRFSKSHQISLYIIILNQESFRRFMGHC